MTKPTKILVDCSTGATTEVELTNEEIEQRTKDAAQHQALTEQRLAQEQAKAEAKASALAKLAALGLTEDEAKAVIG